MMKEIGDASGKIWTALGEKGEQNVESLPRKLKIKSAVVYQGLGWLARENKVQYRTNGGKTYVSLTPGEEVCYQLHKQGQATE